MEWLQVRRQRYDRAHIQNYSDRFRFTTLQSRYATFIELWDRGLRAREEGRPGPFAHKRVEPERPKKGPENRILHVAAFKDPDGHFLHLMMEAPKGYQPPSSQ